MRTNSKDTTQLNGYQLLWLLPGDPIDTTIMPSYGACEGIRKMERDTSYMNIRNGSVVSLTISRRGNRSFVRGVAVCLLESMRIGR